MDKMRSTESEENEDCSVREETQSEEQAPKEVKEKGEISKPNPSQDDEDDDFPMTAARPADTDQLSSRVMLSEEVQVSHQDNIVSENVLPVSMESSNLPLEDQSINKAEGSRVTNDQSLLTKRPITKTTENTLQNPSGSEVLHSSPDKHHRNTKAEEPPGLLNSSEVALGGNSSIQNPEPSCSWMVKTPEKVLKRGKDSPWMRYMPDPPKKSDKSREIKIDIQKLKMSKRKLLQKYALPPTPENSDDEMHVAVRGVRASESSKRFLQLRNPLHLPARDVFPNTSDKIRDSNSQFISSRSGTEADSSQEKGNAGCSEEINRRSEKRKRQSHTDTEDENESEESKAIKSPATISSSPASYADVTKSSSLSTFSCQKAFHDQTTPETSQRKGADSFETPSSATPSRIASRQQRSLSAPEAESPSKYESERIKRPKLSEHSSEEGSNRSNKILLPHSGSVTPPKYIQRKHMGLPYMSLPCTPSGISTKKSSALRRKDVEKTKSSSSESIAVHFGHNQQTRERKLSTTFPPLTGNQSSSVVSPTQMTSEEQADKKQSGNSYTMLKLPTASDSECKSQAEKNLLITNLQPMKLWSPIFLDRPNSSSTETEMPANFPEDRKTSGDEITANKIRSPNDSVSIENSETASFEKEIEDGQSVVGENRSEDDRADNKCSVTTYRTGGFHLVTKKCRNYGDTRYGESSQVMSFEHGMTEHKPGITEGSKQDALAQSNISAVTPSDLETANAEPDIDQGKSQCNVSSSES